MRRSIDLVFSVSKFTLRVETTFVVVRIPEYFIHESYSTKRAAFKKSCWAAHRCIDLILEMEIRC